jgi:HEAT repeat protein
MKHSHLQAVAAVALLVATAVFATASDIDKNIQDLKHQDPEVRAKAAYDLGCG